MPLAEIKLRIGDDAYGHLEREAQKEVALAMQMDLRDVHHQPQTYTPRFLLGDLLPECESLEKAGLKISPIEITDVLFRCKLLRAAQTEQEYGQRRGIVSLFHHAATVPAWSERNEPTDALIDRYIDRLEAGIRERTLLAHIDSFTPITPDSGAQEFFDDLFAALNFPLVCFLEGDHLIEKHQQREPGLGEYDQAKANRFFSAPSIGFSANGSEKYCFWYSSMWLRTFLNMLRIASYIHPGQRTFGDDVQMTAPVYPVFLGTHSQGVYQWDQDKRESWAKIPDGSLFLSFGFRGISKMWLDFRVFPKLRKFMLDHKKVFDCLTNPWNRTNINVVAPALDILSSATQIPDLGAKILLVYCCLEHLFVPKGAYTENKKYIIGGMNALGPHLLPWFDSLYDLRCSYAHKGFVLRDEGTMTTVRESIKNVMSLLVGKLSVPEATLTAARR